MKIDSKGNIILSSMAILIISILLITIFVFTSLNYIENKNIDSEVDDSFKYIIDDYTNNIEVLGRNSIEDACEKVYHSFKLFDSHDQIKKNLDKKLEEKNNEFMEKYAITISSETLSVESTDSPWKVLFKVKVNVEKDNEKFTKIIEKNVSVEGLKDPLPPAILTVAGGMGIYDDKIHYGNALTRYLFLHHVKSSESYLFATAPLTIKKCPYDPYIHHGDPGVLDDCLDKGYFHESADGSCYLCRLEGKGTCPHYGFEVFIQPHTPLNNESVSGSDHVVFHDHYTGSKIDETDLNSLILDSSHRKKYGLIEDDGQ